MFFDTPLYNRLFSGNNREMCASSNPIDRSKGASAGIYRTLRFLLVPTDAVRAPLHFHPVGSSRIPVTSFSFQGWANTSIHLGRRRFFRVESGGGGGKIFLLREKRWTRNKIKREGAVEEWEGRQLISSSCFFLIGGWGWKVKPEKKGGGKRKKEIAEGPDRVVVVAQSVTHKRRTTLPPLRRCTHTHMYPAHSTSTSRSSRMISLQHSSAATQVVVLFIIFLGRPVDSLGSCKEAGLCCTGRDASCVVQKTPQNAIIEDLRDTPCYCDHACLKLNDCCPDYRQTCGGSTTIYLSYCPIFSRFYWRAKFFGKIGATTAVWPENSSPPK